MPAHEEVDATEALSEYGPDEVLRALHELARVSPEWRDVLADGAPRPPLAGCGDTKPTAPDGPAGKTAENVQMTKAEYDRKTAVMIAIRRRISQGRPKGGSGSFTNKGGASADEIYEAVKKDSNLKPPPKDDEIRVGLENLQKDGQTWVSTREHGGDHPNRIHLTPKGKEQRRQDPP